MLQTIFAVGGEMSKDLCYILGWSAIFLVLLTFAPSWLWIRVEENAVSLVIFSVLFVFVIPRLIKSGAKA